MFVYYAPRDRPVYDISFIHTVLPLLLILSMLVVKHIMWPIWDKIMKPEKVWSSNVADPTDGDNADDETCFESRTLVQTDSSSR